jgi:hypothetical protein
MGMSEAYFGSRSLWGSISQPRDMGKDRSRRAI